MLPATVATSLSQSAYTPTPVVHSAATIKGGNYGHKPRNATKDGERDMQCDILSKVCKRACKGCGLKIRTGSSALQSSVGGAVLLIVLSVFPDGLSSVLCPGISSGVVVEMAPVPSEGEPMAPRARRGYSSDLG